MTQVIDVPLTELYFDKEFNCRGEFTPQSCSDLAESMRSIGLQSPIIIQPAVLIDAAPVEYPYRIVMGHRRYTAARYLLRWDTIPCIVREGLSEEDAQLLNLSENLQRKNLSLWEQSCAIRAVFPDPTAKPTWSVMARTLHRGATWCRIRYLIQDLPESAQQGVRDGVLGAGDVSVLISRDEATRAADCELMVTARHAGMTSEQARQPFVPNKKPQTRRAIQLMLTHLMLNEIDVSPYRALAWAAGDLKTEEFLQDLTPEMKC